MMETEFKRGECLIRGLFFALRQLRSDATRKFSEYNIGFEQLEVLFCVIGAEKESMSISEIASFLDKDKATISRAVKSLESKGLVLRQTIMEDKRMIQVKLSDQGMAKIMEAKQEKDFFLAKIESSISKTEQKLFLNVLIKILEAMGSDIEDKHLNHFKNQIFRALDNA